MNYRHAYHAGNFADVLKHVLLVRVLLYLLRKDKPFRVIDIHAGRGFYDLSSDEAGRTGEWRGGIGRLDETPGLGADTLLAPYLDIVRRARLGHEWGYPGSPYIVNALLRPSDKALFAELHPVEAEYLERLFPISSSVTVVCDDGWKVLKAALPPPERRGLVLIDPPFEDREEWERLISETEGALRKWPTGLFMIWYPIKDVAAIEGYAHRLAAWFAPVLRIELMIERPRDPTRLNGCGLFVVNPPWSLKKEAEILLPALAARLGRSNYGGYRCAWIVPET